MGPLQTASLVVIITIGVADLVAAARGAHRRAVRAGCGVRLGRVRDGTHGPGLTLIAPWVDRLAKADLRITTMSVPAQDGVTRDNVSARLDAVVHFRVVDPIKPLVNVPDYLSAVSRAAQTSLRAVIGRANLDELLSDRNRLNAELTDVIGSLTEGPWGVKIERVELTDVALPVPLG
jgi:regulator of protease activity HflC (stomatin/prohibitin superfamily)